MLKYFVKYRVMVLGCLLFLACYGYYKNYEVQFLKNMIPAKLEIESTLYANRGELKPCGAALFRLSDKTIQQIKEQGINFFKGVNVARLPIKEGYNRFKEWKETPYSNEELSNGPFIGDSCMTRLDKQSREILYAATNSKGNFRAIGLSGPSILVVPSEKIVLIEYFDF